jgi:hypothetical protein
MRAIHDLGASLNRPESAAPARGPSATSAAKVVDGLCVLSTGIMFMKGSNSVGSAAKKHNAYRAVQDEEIQPNGAVPDIHCVQTNAFVVGRVVPAGHLPKTSQSALDAGVLGEGGSVPAHFGLHDGTGANQAHLVLENIPQLRQFIEAGLA